MVIFILAVIGDALSSPSRSASGFAVWKPAPGRQAAASTSGWARAPHTPFHAGKTTRMNGLREGHPPPVTAAAAGAGLSSPAQHTPPHFSGRRRARSTDRLDRGPRRQVYQSPRADVRELGGRLCQPDPRGCWRARTCSPPRLPRCARWGRRSALMGLVASHPITCTFTGDASLSGRPMGRVIEPLSQMGADITSLAGRAAAADGARDVPGGADRIHAAGCVSAGDQRSLAGFQHAGDHAGHRAGH